MGKFTMLLALLALGVGTTWAQQVSVAEAMARAKAFVQSGSNGRAKAAAKAGDDQLSLAYTCKDKAEKNVCYYVFNDGNGFVIVGGDEAAQQILGYSDNGAFDYDKAPENMKWWLSQYQQQISAAISYAEANPEAAKAARAKAARKKASTKADIEPLLKTTWSQNDPFNSELPSLGDNYAPLVTGCVATAMAQVMKYYNYPTTGIGTMKSYTQTWSNADIGPKTFEADFANTTYDWANMLNDYSGLTSVDNDKAVGTLMYHCGVAVDMHYGQSGSSASASKIDDALVNYFNYNNSVRYLQRDYYADDAWENMVYNELKNGRPVIYGGQATSSGHCFVCDGYQASDNTYHINWGWEGLSDGCYALTGTNALTPSEQGTGGAGDGSSYTGSQEMVINIIASAGGLETPVVYFNGVTGSESTTFSLSDGSTTTTEYTHAHGTSTTITLSEAIANFSRSLTSFTLGVKATDTTTGLEYIFPSNKTANLTYLQGTTVTTTFDADKLPFNGTYKINAVVRNTSSSSNDDWYEVGVKPGISQPTVTVTGATDPTKTDVELTISNDEVQVSRTIQVEHTSAYKGAITYTSSNTSVATVDENGVVTGVKAGTVEITATAAGNTYFNETAKTFDINVLPLVKSDLEVTISATCLAVGETALISYPEDYTGDIMASTSDTRVAKVSERTVTGIGWGTAKITLEFYETAYYKAKTVTFNVTVTGDDIYFTEAPYFSNDNNIWSGDGLLHYSIKNNSTSAKTNLYLMMQIYKDTEEGYEGKGYSYIRFPSFPASYSHTATFDFIDDSGTMFANDGDGTRYMIEFYKDAEMAYDWNIPSITFTYRAPLSHKYTITDAGVGTLILPFNAEIPTKDDSNNAISWKAYECLGMDGSTLVLNEVTSMKRNTPYIITGDAATYTFNGPKAVDDTPVLFGNGVLKGTMLEETYQFVAGDYILQNLDNGAAFYKYDSTVEGASSWKAAPYRAFLQLDGSSSLQCAAIPGFTKDITTGINAVTGAATKAAGIYTVGGTKVSQLQPGLNIIVDEQGNAVKVFIKK